MLMVGGDDTLNSITVDPAPVPIVSRYRATRIDITRVAQTCDEIGTERRNGRKRDVATVTHNCKK